MKIGISIIALTFFQLAFGQDPPQYGTPFNGVPDPRDASIYQVNIRAFSEGGNFQGVTNRLDQIAALGVNVLYLMPCTPVGVLKTANSPYCVKDYKAVNPEFGTLGDLRTLVQEAHKRGMAVILDWVANHTAWDHPWITAHPNWYEQDGSGNIQPAKVNGFVWNDVAKLNFDNQDMRLGMIDALRYWIFAANVDGFRCDFVDGPPVDFWKQANGNLRGISTHKLILYAEGGRLENYTAFDYNHGFSFYDGLKAMFGGSQLTALKVEAENDAQYKGAGESNRLVRYITNHDVNGWDGPPQNLFGGQAGAMAAFVLVAFNKSVPLIYNGQEIALNYALTFPFTGQKINWNPNKEVTDEYAKLIKFRNASEAIRRGAQTSYSTKDISAFVKTTDKEKVLVLVNIRNQTLQFTLPSGIANATWYNGFDKSAVKFGTTVTLAPYQYMAVSAAPLVASGNIRMEASKAGEPAFRTRFENSMLTVTGMIPGSRLEVRDVKGKSVFGSISRKETESIDLRNANAGIYIVTLNRPDGMHPYTREILR